MTVKVGDTVIALVDVADITKGNEYIVGCVYDDGGIMVYDDVGDNCVLYVDDYTTHANTQYIRILEAIAGEQLTTMARNINEALNNAP